MNIYIKFLPLTFILLSGCTPTKLVMKVDTALEANSAVYKLNYPDSLSDKLSGKRLNISFGPYRVTNANVSLKKIGWQAEDPDSFFTFKNTRRSDNTTTTTKLEIGPTSILGFSRPAAEGEPSIKRSIQKITYKFKVGQEITWNALCAYKAEERVIQYENTNSVELLWSNFTCQYTAKNKIKNNKSNNDIWILSVDHGGAITMTQKGKPNTLYALSTGGKYVTPKGQATKLTTRTAGFTWSQTNNGNTKNIAAISAKEETPRIWLLKGNTDSMNHILSMANTGLLIYSWEINP